jgi:hypothetical protein
MAFFADLTTYVYGAFSPSYAPERDEPWPGVPVVNVGWLDAEHPFPTGLVPPEVLARLSDQARVRVRQTRGYHFCELCVRDLGGGSHVQSLDSGARNDLYESLPRESAEFRIRGIDVVYAAPQLVLHYIAAHQYLPPAEFCHAAMTSAPGAEGR